MALTIRRAWLIVILALGLLAGLAGWTVRLETPAPVHAVVTTSTHQLAFGRFPYCPPPPYNCW